MTTSQTDSEVFANENTALTALIFPPPDSSGVEVFTDDRPVSLSLFESWKLKSIWTDQP